MRDPRRYWLTIQWPWESAPRGRTDTDEEEHSSVWLQARHLRQFEAAELPGPGDLIAVYETRTGLLSDAGRREGRVLPVGKQAIVMLRRVTEQCWDALPKRYDGRRIDWRLVAKTSRVGRSRGSVPREQLVRMLGLAPAYVFRNFGRLGSGLKRLSPGEFEMIRAAMNRGE